MTQSTPTTDPPGNATASPIESGAEAVDASTLSDELRSVVEEADGQPMTIGQILDHLRDRGSALFIVIVTVPFLLLPTTFGLSAPLGIAIAILGLCQATGRKPWLPGFILRKSFPYESLQSTMERAARFSRWVEKVSKPRLTFMLWPGVASLAGVGLIIWGLLMGLPGPNNVFAAMILVYAFGLLMRDGLLLLLGHVLTFTAPILAFIYWNEIWAFVTETWNKFAGLLS